MKIILWFGIDYKWSIYLVISVEILHIGITGLTCCFKVFLFCLFPFNKDLTCQLIITELIHCMWRLCIWIILFRLNNHFTQARFCVCSCDYTYCFCSLEVESPKLEIFWFVIHKQDLIMLSFHDVEPFSTCRRLFQYTLFYHRQILLLHNRIEFAMLLHFFR